MILRIRIILLKCHIVMVDLIMLSCSDLEAGGPDDLETLGVKDLMM